MFWVSANRIEWNNKMIICRECGFKAPDKVIDNFSITICPNCNLPLFNLEEEKQKALEMAKSLGISINLDTTAVREESEIQIGETQGGVMGQTRRADSIREQSSRPGVICGLTRRQYDEFIEELGEKEK